MYCSVLWSIVEYCSVVKQIVLITSVMYSKLNIAASETKHVLHCQKLVLKHGLVWCCAMQCSVVQCCNGRNVV